MLRNQIDRTFYAHYKHTQETLRNWKIHFEFLIKILSDNYFYLKYNLICIVNNLHSWNSYNFHFQIPLYQYTIFVLYFLFFLLYIRSILLCHLNDEHSLEFKWLEHIQIKPRRNLFSIIYMFFKKSIFHNLEWELRLRHIILSQCSIHFNISDNFREHQFVHSYLFKLIDKF